MWLLILPSGCYIFPCKIFVRIWCWIKITTYAWYNCKFEYSHHLFAEWCMNIIGRSYILITLGFKGLRQNEGERKVGYATHQGTSLPMVFCSMGVSSHGDTFNSWFDNYNNMFIQSQLYYLCFYPCNIFGINSWLFWILLIIVPFLCRLVFHILISLSSGFTKGLSVILILRYFVFRLLTNRLILSSWLFFCVCVWFFFFGHATSV